MEFVHIYLIFYNKITNFYNFSCIFSVFSLKFFPPGFGSTALTDTQFEVLVGEIFYCSNDILT